MGRTEMEDELMAAAAIIGTVLSALAGANKNKENQPVQQYNFGQAAQAAPMGQSAQPQATVQPMPTEQTPTGGQ